MIRSRALRRTGFLSRRTRLRPKSAKQISVVAELDALLRQAVLLRDGFRCRRCSHGPVARISGERAVWLVAAHIYGKGAHPGMRYVLENVLCLCDGPQSCHAWFHKNGFGREGTVRQWVVAELGHVFVARLDEMAAQDHLGDFDPDRVRASLEAAIQRLTTPIPFDDQGGRYRRLDVD